MARHAKESAPGGASDANHRESSKARRIAGAVAAGTVALGAVIGAVYLSKDAGPEQPVLTQEYKTPGMDVETAGRYATRYITEAAGCLIMAETEGAQVTRGPEGVDKTVTTVGGQVSVAANRAPDSGMVTIVVNSYDGATGQFDRLHFQQFVMPDKPMMAGSEFSEQAMLVKPDDINTVNPMYADIISDGADRGSIAMSGDKLMFRSPGSDLEQPLQAVEFQGWMAEADDILYGAAQDMGNPDCLPPR